MDLNTFTHKAQQAVLEARSEAERRHHPAASTAHLLMALLGQGDGIVYPLLTRLDIDPASLKATLSEALDTVPRVFGDTENRADLPGTLAPGAPEQTLTPSCSAWKAFRRSPVWRVRTAISTRR